jgi:hypothetical protein
MKRSPLFAVLILSAASGCMAVRPESDYSPMYDPEYGQREKLEGSLFKSDTDALSNEAINEILSKRVEIPDRCKIAMVNLGSRPYARTGNEGEYLKIIADAVAKSPKDGQVSPIPALLMPERMTVSSFRQAAARLQCDLVLMYWIRKDVRYKGHTFSPDTAQAYVTIEALLLHTRTGLIPWTTISDQKIKAEETKADKEERGFGERVEREATAQALQEVAADLQRFLTKIGPKAEGAAAPAR